MSGDTHAPNVAMPTLDNYAVYTSNSGASTAPVKSKLPNALGIYDMSGNVCELCSDTIVYGTTIYRVKRGGGYPSDELNVIVNWQFTIRPNERSEFGGFRFVRNR